MKHIAKYLIQNIDLINIYHANNITELIKGEISN